MRRAVSLALVACGILATPAICGEVYRVRYDDPAMTCEWRGAGRASCRGVNVYPAAPEWLVEHAPDGSVREYFAGTPDSSVSFEIPASTWVHVTMDVVRWDGELLEIGLGLWHDASGLYWLPLRGGKAEREGRKVPAEAMVARNCPGAPPPKRGQ